MNGTCSQITWGKLHSYIASVALIALTIGGAMVSWGWSVHIAQPHPGAVTQDEYRHNVNQFDNRLIRIEDKIDSLLTKK